MTTHVHRPHAVTARINTGSPELAAPRGKSARNPYNATSVRYVESAGGRMIHAVWMSDPAIDPAEALENILRTDLPYEVEVIAEATRFYKKEGADFSGWVVASHGGLDHSDPIPTKRNALKHLRWAVADRFKPKGN